MDCIAQWSCFEGLEMEDVNVRWLETSNGARYPSIFRILDRHMIPVYQWSGGSLPLLVIGFRWSGIDASGLIALRGRDERRRVGTEDGLGAWRRSVFSVASRQRFQRLRRILAGPDQIVSKDDACVSVPLGRMAAASSGSGSGAESGPAEHAGSTSGRCRSGQISQSSSPTSSASDIEQSFPGTSDHWASSYRTSSTSCCWSWRGRGRKEGWVEV